MVTSRAGFVVQAKVGDAREPTAEVIELVGSFGAS